MFMRIVAVITILSAVSGLISLILGSRRRASARVLDESIREKKRRQRVLGLLTFWMSAGAFLFLVFGHADPAGILLGLAIAISIVFPIAFIKGGVRLVSGEDAARPLTIAKDVATDEPLGTVISQSKQDDGTKSYRIRRQNGQILEKPADGVKIELQ